MEGVDIINPPKKIFTLAGEPIDFTFVPTRLTLEGLKILGDMEKKAITEAEGFEKMLNVIVKQASKTNPKITVDWLLDNTSIDMIMNLGAQMAGAAEDKKENKGDSAKN